VIKEIIYHSHPQFNLLYLFFPAKKSRQSSLKFVLRYKILL